MRAEAERPFFARQEFCRAFGPGVMDHRMRGLFIGRFNRRAACREDLRILLWTFELYF
jgi:hypothetical protein